ncbi:hypothetical protein ACFL24_01155 [Patescibacteria group bacterium]
MSSGNQNKDISIRDVDGVIREVRNLMEKRVLGGVKSILQDIINEPFYVFLRAMGLGLPPFPYEVIAQLGIPIFPSGFPEYLGGPKDINEFIEKCTIDHAENPEEENRHFYYVQYDFVRELAGVCSFLLYRHGEDIMDLMPYGLHIMIEPDLNVRGIIEGYSIAGQRLLSDEFEFNSDFNVASPYGANVKLFMPYPEEETNYYSLLRKVCKINDENGKRTRKGIFKVANLAEVLTSLIAWEKIINFLQPSMENSYYPQKGESFYVGCKGDYAVRFNGKTSEVSIVPDLGDEDEEKRYTLYILR